jgi:cytochrome oxidase Cu insertion factor (SCO1/SenC/PrrC family)
MRTAGAAILALWMPVFAGLALADAAGDPFEALDVDRAVESVAAPDLALRSLAGREVRLRALHGKVVLLGFFTTS